MLIAGRLFIGVNAGINAGLIPMYLSEISPTNLRGMVINRPTYLLIRILCILNFYVINAVGLSNNIFIITFDVEKKVSR